MTHIRVHSPLVGLLVAGTVWAAATSAAGQTDGYRVLADRVEVRSAAQWQNWTYPADAVTISASGVAPRYVEAPTNAVKNATGYTYAISGKLRDQYATAFDQDNKAMARGGIKGAGSSLRQAAAAIDGDSTTYWEPSPDDSLSSWWLEVDLGRLVSATRVVLRFAPDSGDAPADPFLQFRVYSATGLSPFGQQDQSGALDYSLVGGTTKPNRSQREFSFDVAPLGKASDAWTGRLMQYVRIGVTATAGARAEVVSADRYAALAPADRGAVEYLWRIGGEERLVDVDRYAALPPDQQAGVRYYRRERPRLAEVEVWTVGENLSLDLLQRGGSLHDINPNSFPERAFDGSLRTDWFGLVYRTTGETAEWGLLTVDLGAQFWVDAVRIISRVPKAGGGENLLFGYLLRGSDGSRAPDGSLVWSDLSGQDRQQNLDTRLFEDRFAKRRLRYLEFRNLDVARRTRAYLGDRVQSVVSEIQVLGSGYPPRLILNSGIIDLGQAKNLTTIDWQVSTQPGAAVEIRTRTGDRLRTLAHYYKSDGNEVSTKEEYDKLPSFFRGPVVTESLPGPGWSDWSQPYSNAGEIIRSPSPRRYLMIEAQLLSDDPEAAAELSDVQVHFTSPVARQVVGEIVPKRDVVAGVPTSFLLYLKPTFEATNRGIDRLRLTGVNTSAMELEEVALGTEAQFITGQAVVYSRDADGQFLTPAGARLDVPVAAGDTLLVDLPTTLRRGQERLARLGFGCRLFQSGATFAVDVTNALDGDVWQHVDSGEAVGDQLGVGSGLTVHTPLGGGDVTRLTIDPAIVSPNGDGINDELVIQFAVLKVNAERAVTVDVFDLSGHRVRRLSQTRATASGAYRIRWDGTDEAGRLVPPGTYIAVAGVDSDLGRHNTANRLVAVTY